MGEHGQGNCFNVTENEEERRRGMTTGQANNRDEKAIREKVGKISLKGSLSLILVEDLN
jgi:hypothetical protein